MGVHRHSHHARLRAALLGTTALVVVSVAVLAGAEPAAAQSYDWGGPGSTTTTPIYNLNTNWANPPTGAPPIAAGQSAVFDTNGSNTVTVTTPVAPDSWTFNAGAQSYNFSGAAVNFSLAGPTGGIINNASADQTIANSIGESVAGVQVQHFGGGVLTFRATIHIRAVRSFRSARCR